MFKQSKLPRIDAGDSGIEESRTFVYVFHVKSEDVIISARENTAVTTPPLVFCVIWNASCCETPRGYFTYERPA